MAGAPTKLLVLGIDAASPELLLRWAGDGTLPHIAALLEGGLSGRSQSLEGFFIGSTWPSFATGLSPAGHGIHYLVQLIPGSYRYHRPDRGAFLKAEPFWSRLSAAGKRVAVLDVPLSRLETALHGIQVVEWGAHDALFGFRTSPPALAREITQRFGSHPAPVQCDGDRRGSADYAQLVDALTRGAELKGRLTRELLREGGWDCFVQVFTEAHCAGHQAWHLHDPSHPAHDPAVTAALGDPLRRVYRAIDAALGGILAEAGDAQVILLAGHGMSYWYGAQFLLPEILQRLGVWHPDAKPPDVPRGPTLRAARWAWRCLPQRIRRGLEPVRARWTERPPSAELPVLDLDPERSRCFPVGNGLAVGAIRLNLAGREPQGILSPKDAEAFCADLRAGLLEIVDERTGGPLIRRVLTTKALYAGPYLGELPDLLIEWNDAVPTGSTQVAGGVAARVRASSPRIGVVEGENSYGRTGEHRREGLFIAKGRGLHPGRLERDVSILDFAPTVGVLLGVPLADCDGKPIGELIPRDQR